MSGYSLVGLAPLTQSLLPHLHGFKLDSLASQHVGLKLAILHFDSGDS